MSYNLAEGAAFAVRSGYLDLLDLISSSAAGHSEVDSESLQIEAEKFVVAMIASIILADGQIRQEEADFLRDLLNIGEAPGGAVRYVNDYASRWSVISASVPKFFSHAAEHDREAAQAMLRMIQLIGNNCSIPDRVFSASEHQAVQKCIGQLEAELARHER